MSRYNSTGNSRPWIVQDGYRHSLRVPGPLYREPEHGRWGKPLAWLLIGFAVLLLAGNTWGAA